MNSIIISLMVIIVFLRFTKIGKNKRIQLASIIVLSLLLILLNYYNHVDITHIMTSVAAIIIMIGVYFL